MNESVQLSEWVGIKPGGVARGRKGKRVTGSANGDRRTRGKSWGCKGNIRGRGVLGEPLYKSRRTQRTRSWASSISSPTRGNPPCTAYAPGQEGNIGHGARRPQAHANFHWRPVLKQSNEKNKPKQGGYNPPSERTEKLRPCHRSAGPHPEPTVSAHEPLN